MGDACRLLQKEDVSHAIGVEIVRTHSEDNGCTYIAKGTQADMTAKHVSAMMAARGADKQAQQMIQNFAGGMGKVFESEKPQSEQDTSGEVPVFNFSVDQNAAEEQIELRCRNARGHFWETHKDCRELGSGIRLGRRHNHGAQRQDSDPDHVHHVPLRHRSREA